MKGSFGFLLMAMGRLFLQRPGWKITGALSLIEAYGRGNSH